MRAEGYDPQHARLHRSEHPWWLLDLRPLRRAVGEAQDREGHHDEVTYLACACSQLRVQQGTGGVDPRRWRK
jgi:hypothetical protein